MTKNEFLEFPFSSKTEVKLFSDERWLVVTEVDFGREKIGTDNGYYFSYNQVKEIK